MLFVCENNGWSRVLTDLEQIAVALEDLAARLRDPAYAASTANDVATVADAARASSSPSLRGGGPAILECMTHARARPFRGRRPKVPPSPTSSARSPSSDPVRVAAAKLLALGSTEARARPRRRGDRVRDRKRRRRGAERHASRRSKRRCADVYTPVEAR